MLKLSGVITKLLLIASVLILVLWSVPRMLNYYEIIDSYSIKKSELQEARIKYNISQDTKKIKIDTFEQELNTIVSDAKIEPRYAPQSGYNITLQIDKNKIKRFNNFIETLSLCYLVKIKNNKLSFEEQDQQLEVKFILENL
jgi:hypothetical protein